MPWALPVPGTATAAAPVIAMAIIAFVNIRIRCSPIVLFAASRKGAHRDNAHSVGQFLLRPVAPLLTFDHGFGSSLTALGNHMPITILPSLDSTPIPPAA